jgi:transcriptional regulator GlxA family with amidase domain
MAITIGILLFDDAEELDFVGPWEVFKVAALGREENRVVTIAERAKPVRCANGLRVIPDHTFDDAPPLDVILVPGGMGTRREAENHVLIDWLRDVSSQCLVEAGPAKGKRIVTHWAFVDPLRQRGEATVLEKVRYVRDGNVVTAAGVSAGIDMALWLVGQLYSVEHARGIQRLIEYDPAPPYTAEV